MSSRRPILLAQATASLGLAAGGAAGGLLAVAITGNDASAAAPLGAMVLGAGVSAPAAAAIMVRAGRVAGLVACYLAGALGASLVLLAAGIGSLPWLVAGHFLLGSGNTAVMLSRYAVADLSPRDERGRAISSSMLTITVGAVIGPNLLGPASSLAQAVDLPGVAGMYGISVAAFLVAALLLRGGPGLHGEAVAPTAGSTFATDTGGITTWGPAGSTVAVAIAVLTTANITMVSIMAVAPAHLHHHGTGLTMVGMVVSLHIGAMFAASPLLGRLSDRYGPVRLAAAGAVLLTVAGLLPLVVDTFGLLAMTGLLILLGIGWNVQVVAGSALLHLAAPVHLRPRLEGRGELAMSLGAAAGSLFLAGPLVAAGGMPLLAATTIPLNLSLLLLVRGRRTAHPEVSASVSL